MISKLKSVLFGSLPNSATKFYNGQGNFVALTATGAWTLISSVTASGSGNSFTDLSGYNELLIVIRAVTCSGAAIRQVLVSTDNGSSFLTASGDYKAVDLFGVEANNTSLPLHGSPNASARSGWLSIHNFNVATHPKIAFCPTIGSPNSTQIIPTTSALNAIQVQPSSGTFTGGTIQVYGR